MSNMPTVYKEGQKGKNLGLSTGLTKLDEAIRGLQKKQSICLAASPKCGKTTFADFAFVLHPYLQMDALNKLDDIEFIYFSYEIDRINKEFTFAAFFFYHDFGVESFEYNGNSYQISRDYLMGKVVDIITKELIPVSATHEEMLKEIYTKRIIVLFGEYDSNGRQIKQGKIIFRERAENPTGMYHFLEDYAQKNGSYKFEYYTDKGGQQKPYNRTYKANNDEKFTIVITDHIRKLKRERGYNMKENVDKWLEYTTEFRNECLFTFINIVHSNRNLANVDRLRYAGEFIFPTSDDSKDTGNVAEESTIFMTLFNPNDEKYNLQKHWGRMLKDYPNYRSLHITESRDTPSPVHIPLNMFGHVNYFTDVEEKIKNK